MHLRHRLVVPIIQPSYQNKMIWKTFPRMDAYQKSRNAMVNGQILPCGIRDLRLLDGMRLIRREAFVPKTMRGFACADTHLEITPARFLLAPSVFARMVDAAAINAEDCVLDIGCLRGYSAAILAQLANAIVAIEENSEDCEQANALLSEQNIHNIAIIEAPLSQGCPAQKPFNAIIVEGALQTIPENLTDQLDIGGRLVAILSSLDHTSCGYAVCVTRLATGWARKRLFDASTPLLPGFVHETETI